LDLEAQSLYLFKAKKEKMKIKHIILSTIAFSLIACGSGGGNSDSDATDSTAVESNEMQEDYSQMQEVDLSEYGVMASMYVPNGNLMIEESGYGSIVLRVGDRFGIEVVPFGMEIVEKRNELEAGTVFQVEVLEERTDYMFFKKFIPGSEVLQEFHVYLTRDINGELVAVKSLDDMEMKEAQAREVLKSAKSIKAKEAA
tara:strand:- start:2219 stop:2815 length:597 start_codon:yes stop_codon:yes gene_type:complete